MKKIFLLIILILPLLSGYGQEQMLSCPSIGAAFVLCEIIGDDAGKSYIGGAEENIILPALEMRYFHGVKPFADFGYYAGVEAGTLVFFSPSPFGESFSDFYKNNKSLPDQYKKDYTVFLEYNIGTVFLLAKFGYNFSLGLFRLGIEGGPGVRASRGSVKLSNDQSEFDDIKKYLAWTDDPVFIDMMMDLTLKLGLSITENCEIALLTSCMTIPAFLEEPDKLYWYQVHDDLRSSVMPDEEWQDDEIIGLLERYRVRLIGPTLSMKLGVVIIY